MLSLRHFLFPTSQEPGLGNGPPPPAGLAQSQPGAFSALRIQHWGTPGATGHHWGMRGGGHKGGGEGGWGTGGDGDTRVERDRDLGPPTRESPPPQHSPLLRGPSYPPQPPRPPSHHPSSQEDEALSRGNRLEPSNVSPQHPVFRSP